MDAFQQQLNIESVPPQIHSKLLKSFDSIGSAGHKSGHKRYKSSGGSSNLSSFSNESKQIRKWLQFFINLNAIFLELLLGLKIYGDMI